MGDIDNDDRETTAAEATKGILPKWRPDIYK